MLAWVYLRPVGPRSPLCTGVDIAAISLLAALSEAFSHARLGFFIVPVMAFRFRPAITALPRPWQPGPTSSRRSPTGRRPAGGGALHPHAGGFSSGLACVLLSDLLARRTEAVCSSPRAALGC